MLAINPKTKVVIKTRIPSEPKKVAFDENTIFLANYPRARVYAFNISDFKKKRDLILEKPLFVIEKKQNRPKDMLITDEFLFVATEPDEGCLGGALTIYNKKDKSLIVLRNLVDKFTINSLYYDDSLYFSTSVRGGHINKPQPLYSSIFKFDINRNSLSEVQRLDDYTISSFTKFKKNWVIRTEKSTYFGNLKINIPLSQYFFNHFMNNSLLLYGQNGIYLIDDNVNSKLVYNKPVIDLVTVKNCIYFIDHEYKIKKILFENFPMQSQNWMNTKD